MKIEAIVPAAGQGLRLKSNISKPFILINNFPIIIRTLKILNRHSQINKIIVLSNKIDLKKLSRLINIHKIKKVKCAALGGRTRKKSVAAGLGLLDKDTDFVLIHDGVRPFVSKDIISRTILGAKKFGAAIAAVRLESTLKKITVDKKYPRKKRKFFVKSTLDRRHFWEIQTPQVFKKGLIVAAHAKFKNAEATDDAYLVEKLGKKISVVEGSYFNIKITTREDLVFARAIANYKL